tara:strand:+ start:1542 stop:1796 length:255 start_codon:yes stop_codon:yes gene_type:complete
MKALTLAAVIALSATGAAAWEATNDVLTKGIKITEFDNPIFGEPMKEMLYLYKGLAYYCYAKMGKTTNSIRVGCNVQKPIGLIN